jgi:acyl carrier protein
MKETTMNPPIGTVEDAVSGCLVAALCCEPALVTVDSELTALPGLDSSKLLRVVAELERRYDVGLDDDRLYEVRKVGDLAELVHVELAEQVRLEGCLEVPDRPRRPQTTPGGVAETSGYNTVTDDAHDRPA